MIRGAFLLLVFLGTLSGLPAEPGAASGRGPAAAVLSDQDEKWSVGVCALRGRDLSDRNAYLAVGLPLLVRERLEPILTHTLSAPQVEGQRRLILGRERQAVRDLLVKAQAERDRLLFGDLKETDRESRLRAQERVVAGHQSRLAELAEVDPASIRVPERKDVEFLQGEADGGLLEPPAFSALRFAREHGAELLIGGELEELEGYLYVEIFALDAVREEEVFAYRDALRPEEVYTALEGVADGLAGLVLGQPYGTVTLTGLPEGSQVGLDGRFVGTGLSVLRYLPPGGHTVTVHAPDGREGRRQVVLEGGETEELAFELRESETAAVRLDSVPTGARVWSGSLFLGTTPLEVPRPEGSTRLLLRLDGYRDTAWYLEPSSPAGFTVELGPLQPDPALLQRQERNRFYRAFGLWAVTLPLPFLLYAQTVDYAVATDLAQSAGDLAEAARLARLGTASWYGYLGGMALNVGLLVNLVLNLRDYIRSADRKAGG